MTHVIALFRLLFITVLITIPQAANANLNLAYQALQSKNYTESLKQFKNSAHLGVVEAQLKVAGLYANGLGTKVDPVQSYLYIALASEYGSQDASLITETIFNHLTSTQQQRAKKQWLELQSQYGVSALSEKALPILRNKPVAITPARKKNKSDSASTSMYALRRSLLASAIIEFDIGIDGRVRDVEVERNVFMNSSTQANIIAEMNESDYKPAKVKGKNKKIKSYGNRSVWAQRTITHRYIKDNTPDFNKLIIQLEKAAELGDANAQYQVAMFYLVFPSLDVNTVRYVDYIKKAAQALIPEAQVEYAQLLIQGRYVSKDEELAINNLLQAAKAGYARAQYKLARQYLSGRFVVLDEEKAFFWLKEAVAQQDDYAKYWLARLYVSSTNKQFHKPTVAKQLLSDVYQQQRENPNWYYFSAIAEFKLGNNADAKNLLDNGLDMAKDYSWNVQKFDTLTAKLANNIIKGK